jgi:ribosomal protein S6--L-glutamate ligase
VGRAWPGGPLIVGWTEHVALPDWGIPSVRAKMDTGARTSALHVENVEEVGGRHVRFDVVLDRKRSHRRVHVKARIVRRARVRSSNGEYSYRLFVSTRLRLGPLERQVEFSLVDRARMIHRVLLGRSALHGVFVDVGHRHLLGRRKRKVKRRKRRVAEG